MSVGKVQLDDLQKFIPIRLLGLRVASIINYSTIECRWRLPVIKRLILGKPERNTPDQGLILFDIP